MVEFPSLFGNNTLFVVRELRDRSSCLKMCLAAIIRRAAFDIALYHNDKKLINRRLAIQATKWMFDDREMDELDPLDRFTSFNNICEVLDQDPARIRRKTLALRASDVKKCDRVGSI